MMTALEFIKTVQRLLKTTKSTSYSISMNTPPELILDSIEQWGKANPIRTRHSEFLKLFPNAATGGYHDFIDIAPCEVDVSLLSDCNGDCNSCHTDYWGAEI